MAGQFFPCPSLSREILYTAALPVKRPLTNPGSTMRKEECNYTENITGSPSLFQLKVLGGQKLGGKNKKLQ